MNAIMRRSAAQSAGLRTSAGHYTWPRLRHTVGRRRVSPLAVAMCCAIVALSACSNREVAWLEDTPFSFMTSALVVSESSEDGTTALSGEQSPEDALASGSNKQISKAAPAPRARPAARATKAGRDIRPAIAHPSATPTPGRNRLNPNKLVGLDEREVIRLLGQPERVRSKPPATVWSYTVDKCTLDVSFYLDLASERFRVLAYEVNSARNSEEMKKVCLGRIQSALRTN